MPARNPYVWCVIDGAVIGSSLNLQLVGRHGDHDRRKEEINL